MAADLGDRAVLQDRDAVRRRGWSRGGGRSRSPFGPAAAARAPTRSSRSVRTSTFEVASSRMRMRGSASSALANAISCRCPAESATPRSPTSASKPPGRRLMNSPAPIASAAASTSSADGGGPPEVDVLAHRPAEQESLLRHDSQLAAQALRLQLTQVVPVDQHAAALRVIEARHQLREGALAGAGLAHQRQRLAGGDVDRDIAHAPSRHRRRPPPDRRARLPRRALLPTSA